ncbi:hypothetical protein C8R47DRAFT_1071669 [Mycena vitilis]|nr:hypothetical protein C8R47DRAFT_1071669 [Mycena vitilis]
MSTSHPVKDDFVSKMLSSPKLGESVPPPTASSPDVDMEDQLDYGADEDTPLGESVTEPLDSDSLLSDSSSLGDEDVQVGGNELTSDDIEAMAQTESLRGGGQVAKSDEEIKKLKDEVFNLRVERDVASRLGERVTQELFKISSAQDKLTKEMGELGAELRSERRRRGNAEKALEGVRQRLMDAEDEIEERSRKRARSNERDHRNSRKRTHTPTGPRVNRLRTPMRERTPIAPRAERSRTPMARTEVHPRTVNENATSFSLTEVRKIRAEITLPQGSGRLSANLDGQTGTVIYCRSRWEYATDARGFPVDEDGWWATFDLQSREPTFVHAICHFLLWVYSRDVPEQERTTVQKLAVEHYRMPDWFAGLLAIIDIQRSNNILEKREWSNVKRDEIGYNPELLAQFFQYREVTVRGCRFLDDCWSLDSQDCRGANLRDEMNLRHRRSKHEPPPTQVERQIRHTVDRHFIHIVLNPGKYETCLRALSLNISPVFEPKPWPDNIQVDIQLEDVVRRLAECGVLVALVDDTFMHAFHWAQVS